MKELKEFTVERLEEISSRALVSMDEASALAKIALAAKQAEPVAWITCHQGCRAPDDCEDYLEAYTHKTDEKSVDGSDAFPVFMSPPLINTEQDGWIKCSKQLPHDDDFVLVWPTPDFGVDLHVGQYMKYHKKGAGWFAQVNEQNYGIECHPISVTHWMKLPAAPKPEM